MRDKYFEAMITLRFDSKSLTTVDESQLEEASKGFSIPSRILSCAPCGELVLSL
jgi:hypothetical protein